MYRLTVSSHCELSVVERELHFLTECPRYNSIRKEFYEKVSSVCPEFQLCSGSEKLPYMLGENSELITHAARYVTTCHNLRDDQSYQPVIWANHSPITPLQRPRSSASSPSSFHDAAKNVINSHLASRLKKPMSSKAHS
ncbi:hypothetical protein AOLI_G00137660 [Acnodon oligacanthus]